MISSTVISLPLYRNNKFNPIRSPRANSTTGIGSTASTSFEVTFFFPSNCQEHDHQLKKKKGKLHPNKSICLNIVAIWLGKLN